MHTWMEGIQVGSIVGPRPSHRADNSEIVKIYWKNLTNLFFQNHWHNSTKHSTKHPWMEGIMFIEKKGHGLSLGGDNRKNVKLYIKNI